MDKSSYYLIGLILVLKINYLMEMKKLKLLLTHLN